MMEAFLRSTVPSKESSQFPPEASSLASLFSGKPNPAEKNILPSRQAQPWSKNKGRLAFI